MPAILQAGGYISFCGTWQSLFNKPGKRNLLMRRAGLTARLLFTRSATDNSATVLPLLVDSLRLLKEREGDIQLQHSLASQFEPGQIAKWARGSNDEVAQKARKLMATLGYDTFLSFSLFLNFTVLSISTSERAIMESVFCQLMEEVQKRSLRWNYSRDLNC